MLDPKEGTMSRFIQSDNRPTPKTKEAKPVIKAGSKGYDYSNLANAKKIISPNGGKR